MFEHKAFQTYVFEDVPLNQDLLVVDECYMSEYESAMVAFFNGGDYEPVGYVSNVSARKIHGESIELSWYANRYDRFHEVSILLPRDQFVSCVGASEYDERPRIFVKSDWLEHVYVRSYSIFMMIDAIGVRAALQDGALTKDGLMNLRGAIDELASDSPNVSFISFADSLLLKSNWSVGHFRSDVRYTYDPEAFLGLAEEVNRIYRSVLGLETYAVVAQGSNEYFDEPLLHISDMRNHVSLNSLGVPFAQIMEIDQGARKAIRAKVHHPAELYLDDSYFHSLRFRSGFDKSALSSSEYVTKMRGKPSRYFLASRSEILGNLRA